jgi:CheY-like chemotaxis protein
MEAVGLLAGGVAHDFNNLLVVIESYGELVLQELSEDDPKRADMREIVAAGRRASALTRQLLAFSRRQVLLPRVLDLNEVVSNVDKMLRRIIGEDIDFITALSPSLGTIKADAGQIEQIILNLTVNARDAMPSGGKVIIETSNVRLDEKYAAAHAGVTPGEYVMLSVSDTGTGMDAATQKRIFEPFFTTKGVGKGTGLGLSTVYGIVQQSGGHIWVYSELRRGTSFKLYFARVDSTASASSPRLTKAAPPNGVGTILLVEDDEAVRHVTARILRDRGYTVLETRRPSEARDICAQRGTSIDLLLTDIIMPETSGPRLAEELSRAYPQLRVLYMSGYAGAALEQAGWLDSDAAYLEKPFTPGSLADKVYAIMQPSA